MTVELTNRAVVKLRNGKKIEPLYEDWGLFSNGLMTHGAEYQGFGWRRDGVCVQAPDGVDRKAYDVVKILGVRPSSEKSEPYPEDMFQG